MQEIYMFGAGGHARSLMSLLTNAEFKIYGIYDDSFNPDVKEFINSIEIIGDISTYVSTKKIVLAFGDNNKRRNFFLNYCNDLYKSTIIHTKSLVDDNVVFGQSNFIFANSIINANVKIGDNNIINTGVIIEHEVKIGSHNHISVGSIICGRSSIGNDCFLGAGSVIIDKINICDGVTIGAGAVVTKSIDKSGTYVGIPAKKIK